MKLKLHIAAALAMALAGASVSAQDYPQLAASAGLSPAEAQGMSLNAVFAAKANRGARADDAQAIVSAEDRGTPNAALDQLAASAGLGPDEAAELTLTEIFAAKANRGARDDESQVIVSSRGAAAIGSPATRQLIAQAGLGDTAAGLALNEIAALKANRGTGADQDQTAPF